MTDTELDQTKPSAEQKDELISGDLDSGTYYVVLLYRAASNRMFRYIEQSGMESEFVGASHIGQWLTEDEAPQWKTLPW